MILQSSFGRKLAVAIPLGLSMAGAGTLTSFVEKGGVLALVLYIVIGGLTAALGLVFSDLIHFLERKGPPRPKSRWQPVMIGTCTAIAVLVVHNLLIYLNMQALHAIGLRTLMRPEVSDDLYLKYLAVSSSITTLIAETGTSMLIGFFLLSVAHRLILAVASCLCVMVLLVTLQHLASVLGARDVSLEYLIQDPIGVVLGAVAYLAVVVFFTAVGACLAVLLSRSNMEQQSISEGKVG
jgi:hypothetical protein